MPTTGLTETEQSDTMLVTLFLSLVKNKFHWEKERHGLEVSLIPEFAS